jgi:hypothetical protein
MSSAPISDQQRHDCGNHAAQVEVQKHQGGEQIAKRDALQHAEQPDIRLMLADAAIGHHSENVQNQRAAQNPAIHVRLSVAFDGAWQGQRDRNAVTEMNNGKTKS